MTYTVVNAVISTPGCAVHFMTYKLPQKKKQSQHPNVYYRYTPKAC